MLIRLLLWPYLAFLYLLPVSSLLGIVSKAGYSYVRVALKKACFAQERANLLRGAERR